MLAAMVAGCSNSDKKAEPSSSTASQTSSAKIETNSKASESSKEESSEAEVQRQEIIQKKKPKAKLRMKDFLLSSKMTTGELWSNSVVALVIAMLKALIT